MAKPEWGAKHACSSCGTRFYDMLRNPIVCPSCGKEHVPEKLLKSRKTEDVKPVKAVKAAKPGEDEEEDTLLDDDDLLDADDIDLPDDDDDDDDLSGVVSAPKTKEDD
ncbi:TIGR02300 family protein [Sneathiella chinensis]|uniref:TIGR02300 family protein n=1 Tax=Sneathiella chinensis TaxID=349750 RepID=A0ABQ5TZS4_9PROT|nr:TIGR02300 family protein [Sneathiella chinensis]GLQ04978.1 hypothetical protein GCM10007924_01990 [Sneathiella chinensis]